LLSGIVGFVIAFSATWIYHYVMSEMPDQLNPYVREFPMMRSILIGWFGGVSGLIIGIVSARRIPK